MEPNIFTVVETFNSKQNCIFAHFWLQKIKNMQIALMANIDRWIAQNYIKKFQ